MLMLTQHKATQLGCSSLHAELAIADLAFL